MGAVLARGQGAALSHASAAQVLGSAPPQESRPTKAGLANLRFPNAQVRSDESAVIGTLRAVAGRLRNTPPRGAD
jgi:hypothetical protein